MYQTHGWGVAGLCWRPPPLWVPSLQSTVELLSGFRQGFGADRIGSGTPRGPEPVSEALHHLARRQRGANLEAELDGDLEEAAEVVQASAFCVLAESPPRGEDVFAGGEGCLKPCRIPLLVEEKDGDSNAFEHFLLGQFVQILLERDVDMVEHRRDFWRHLSRPIVASREEGNRGRHFFCHVSSCKRDGVFTGSGKQPI